MTGPPPLLSATALAGLAERLHSAGYTVDGVRERLGVAGAAALSQANLIETERYVPQDTAGDLIRLFLLGLDVPVDGVGPVAEALLSGGFVQRDGELLRAALDLRPYSEGGTPAAPEGRSWWVVSDLGAEVRPGPLAAEHVVGIGAAALTLAGLTSRRPVGAALDVGTGSGVQALHLSGHAASVTATDLSSRALRLAATTAALNDRSWELLEGDLLDPVRGRRFDLVVANAPFVVGPPAGRARYRDGGLGGDEVSHRLLSGLGAVLTDGGQAHVLANWMLTAEPDWTERVRSWLAGSGCDAWVWQRTVAEPGEYINLWLRDGGLDPSHPRWASAYRRWRDWFAANGVLGVGMGVVSLRRTGRPDVIVCEDVPQPLGFPVGDEVDAWFDRADWLATIDDAGLLAARLHRPPDLVRTGDALAGPDGWTERRVVVRRPGGMRWEVEVDEAMAALIAGCSGGLPVGDLLTLLAAARDEPVDRLRATALPLLRGLVRRGLVEPELPQRGGAA